ncbi:S8 family serine peptidase [Sphingomonas sp. M1A8_2b]
MTKAKHLATAIAAICAMAGIARAQLGLPSSSQMQGPVPALGDVLRGDVLRPIDQGFDRMAALSDRVAQRLADSRAARIADLVRTHPDRIAIDPDGFPARAGEVVVDDADDALIAKAVAGGYTVIERGDILGVGFARFSTPPGQSLKTAIRGLQKLGARQVSADSLHVQSGGVTPGAPQGSGRQTGASGGSAVGIIDGGAWTGIGGQRGFASGAPRPSDHGSAVASLIVGRDGVRGADPAARLHVADVYGSDPAGGNATAIAKALGWLVGERVPVVTISLVGPANPLLARVIAAAQARGTIVVAAVGNDGPASPPSYPASYPGVIAVTGVDARGRVLIEAGRASHLDYAAPGADMLATTADGRAVAVRGTSFAAPFVAATIARGYRVPDQGARAEALRAVDAGAKAGARYGRGLVCAACRTAVQ